VLPTAGAAARRARAFWRTELEAATDPAWAGSLLIAAARGELPFTYQVAANAPPTVTLVYPEAGGILVAGSDVTLTVLAGDDGQVTQVVFRVDGVDQPPIVSPPYALPTQCPPPPPKWRSR